MGIVVVDDIPMRSVGIIAAVWIERVGGWVGYGKVEEEEAVGMRYWELGVLGGWKRERERDILCPEASKLAEFFPIKERREVGGWVGGWVGERYMGGWVGGWDVLCPETSELAELFPVKERREVGVVRRAFVGVALGGWVGRERWVGGWLG